MKIENLIAVFRDKGGKIAEKIASRVKRRVGRQKSAAVQTAQFKCEKLRRDVERGGDAAKIVFFPQSAERFVVTEQKFGGEKIGFVFEP